MTPRNLIEDDGLIVMEPYDMGFGSNPIPINSVFERFKESPAVLNQFIRS